MAETKPETAALVTDAEEDVETALPPAEPEAKELSEDSDEEKVEDDEPSGSLLFEFLGEKLSGKGLYIFLVLLFAYSLAAFILDFRRAILLFSVECVVFGIIAIQYATDKLIPDQKAAFLDKLVTFLLSEELQTSPIASSILVALMAVIVGIICRSPKNLVSALGLAVFVLVTWASSWNPKKVRWWPVVTGIFIQFVLGALILRVQAISDAFGWLGDKVVVFLNFTSAGSSFVYGYLVDGSLYGTPMATADGGVYFLAPPVYFIIFSVIFFLAAVVAILNYFGIVEWAVRKVGITLALLMGTSGPETFNTVANMFLAMTESPLLIRTLLPSLTNSELHAIMTAGFASVAGSVLGAYVGFGASATDLLSASLMSAPAALAISKLAYPETKPRKDKEALFTLEMTKTGEPNLVSAATSGASMAVGIVLQIGAQLIAFIALVAMLDGFLDVFGNLINIELSFKIICSYIFFPFAWLMGTDAADTKAVAGLLGTKLFVNEFAAYAELGGMIAAGELSQRSITIATYALCGFANFGSIGITVAVLGTLMPPERKKDITKLVTSAMFAGNTAAFMTACVAGLFYSAEVAEGR
jgi:pyrimidine nucleoside transport protein